MLNFKNIFLCVQSRLPAGNKPFYILLLVISFVFQSQSSFAQTNLIYNGDFELYDTCPVSTSSPGDLQIETCYGWTAPTKLGTSDYFNVCNNVIVTQPAGVPQNAMGFQYPFNGNGYCGIFAWNFPTLIGYYNYREYLQTKILQPLVSGKNYHFSFYVSYYGVNYSLEKIGALFSANDYNSNSYIPIIATPQVVNQNGFLSDSLNWTKIEGDFFANGGEQFLTIGYFEDTLTVNDTFNTHNEPFVYYHSYYFVDGVELVEKEITIPNVFSPNGDGINDFFNFEFPFTKVLIFNRWGIEVFKTTKPNIFWDGRATNGNEAVDGTYYYIIETQNSIFKGFVQLLR